jgi:hypothetical protein
MGEDGQVGDWSLLIVFVCSDWTCRLLTLISFLAPTPPFRPTRRSRILWVALPLSRSPSPTSS